MMSKTILTFFCCLLLGGMVWAEEQELPPDYVAGNGAKFVRIEAGEFMMGDTLKPEEVHKKYPGGEHPGLYAGYFPQHKVTISKPFYMGAYQVTIGEFREFVDATGYETTAEKEGVSWGFDQYGQWKNIDGLNWKNPGFDQTDQHPVVHVSWHDAQAYVDWMNETHLPEEVWAEGYRYALPTEAMWEYACRAGTTTDFFWGDTAAGGEGYLNGTGKEGPPVGKTLFRPGMSWPHPFPFNDGYKTTSPVGSYKPNPWGLYDMHGNVVEWCSDWYGDYPKDSVTDPVGPKTGPGRVIRGGSWGYLVGFNRSAHRAIYAPTRTSSISGIRLSLVHE